MRRSVLTAAAASAALALVLGTGLAAGATPLAHATGYPSWQDVQNAQKDEAAKQAEITTLTAALQQSQQKAGQAQQDEALKEEAFNTAQAAADAAAAKADQLAAAEASAQSAADAAEKRADGLIAQLDRTGAGDPTLGLLTATSGQADQLLDRLGSMDRLSVASEAIMQKAEFAKNAAAAAAKQAAVAKQRSTDLAAAAKQAYAAAESAAAAAEAEVATEEAAQETMYAQLAQLKNTTAQVEAAYVEGVNQANAAAGIPPLPAGAIGTVIAFAEAQLGKKYVLDGAGPNVWDCSGLTMVAWEQVGVEIGGHGSTMQYNHMKAIGHLVDIPRNSTDGMRPGDLIFYSVNGSPSDSVKTHVAMYIGANQMIEAPNPSKPVRIVPVRYSDYESKIVPQVGRILL